MEIRFLDPQAVPGIEPEPYDVRIDIETEPVTMGVVSNSFVDAASFCDHVGRALTSAVPNLRVIRYRKSDTSPAPADMQAKIVRECDAVISAYGH